jgi:DGQHR domain-containing protein
LKGLEKAGKADFEIAVSIFVGADDATEAALFSTVNLAQTKVNKSLVYDLFALAKNRSPEKTCHEIVVALDRLDDSPFKGRIKRLGAATEGRFGETLSQATIVKGILPYISDDPLLDRDRGKRLGYWEPALAKDLRKRIFYEFFRKEEDTRILGILINYFNAIKAKWPRAWESDGRFLMLNRTNGYNGLIRFLRPAYLAITTSPRVISESEFSQVLAGISLQDEDFTITNFVPGTGGSAKLYRTLLEQSGVSQP